MKYLTDDLKPIINYNPADNSLLPLINHGNGCDFHRLTLPLTEMGINLDFFEEKEIKDVIQDVKILMWNRVPYIPLEYIIALREKHGFKIVVDLDDYWILYPHHIHAPHWKQSGMAEKIVMALKIADAVITTTSILADKIKPYNDNVHIIPNALPFGKGQFNSERNSSENVRFLYASSSSHFWDIQEFKIPFEKVANNPQLSNAQFVLAGYNDEGSLPSIRKANKEFWDKMEKAFTSNGKIKNYLRRRVLPLESYMDHYKDADVALVPLESNNFNRFKSNLKIIEAGCKNIPVICSAVEPYTNETKPVTGIHYAKNAREWYDLIQYFTKNPNAAKEEGEALGSYVRSKYDLTQANEYRKQLFSHLIS